MRGAILILVPVVLLGGCGGVPSTPLMPHATETISAALTRIHSPEITPTSSLKTTEETKTITPGLETTIPTIVVCDPATSDYCIVDGHFALSRPIAPPGNDNVESTYRYGTTQNGLREPHHGVEFPNPSGVPVLAAMDGTVVFAGSDQDSKLTPWSNFYGNAVVIERIYNGQKLFSLYGHLSRIDVAAGQELAAGETIGEVGATGAAIGSHLHFEVRLDDNRYSSTRNPELWLVPREGTGVLAVRVTDKSGGLLRVNLNIQRVLPGDTLESIGQPEAYDFKEKYPVNTDDIYGENFVFGDLPEGKYRLTFVFLGELYERFVEVESGKLTLVNISSR
jgi:hypothetical protein